MAATKALEGEIIPSDAATLAHVERDPYQAAMLTWLQGKTNEPRRSYTTALGTFLNATEKHPSEIEPLDVASWKESLKRRGLTDGTVAQRLSAVSSYYTYLTQQGIHDRNPVAAVGRDDLDVNPHERAHKLPLVAFRRILKMIPEDTEIGARDRALLLFYVLCGRRRSEVVGLRANDLRIEDEEMTYRARLKDGTTKWKELPPPVWRAIRRYLDLAGRDPTGTDPIFIATTDSGKYLRDYYGAPEPDSPQPLTGAAVAQALKRYAAAAGLDPEAVTLDSLRHVGAGLYHEASGEEHRHWQAMVNALGVGV